MHGGVYRNIFGRSYHGIKAQWEYITKNELYNILCYILVCMQSDCMSSHTNNNYTN